MQQQLPAIIMLQREFNIFGKRSESFLNGGASKKQHRNDKQTASIPFLQTKSSSKMTEFKDCIGPSPLGLSARSAHAFQCRYHGARRA